MKKIIVLSIILCICLTGCGNKQENNSKNENNSENYTASRTGTNSTSDNFQEEIDPQEEAAKQKKESNPEEELSSFSTKIYTPNDEGRQNNISITCSHLNETVIKPGETFSFCDTVGKATPERGYQKADVFDKNGNTIKGYGGGNCQISSTLYNAVLSLPSLTVVERHEHSKEVYYVPLGKDAAVAYGSIDFKFRNDYDYDIKIYASNTRDSIDIRIVKI
ncbi:MAG: VanW family protein [Clostridia bacterium]|nr:VanW family protein [Clostridia bacterium]